jgi:uncharacterized protein
MYKMQDDNNKFESATKRAEATAAELQQRTRAEISNVEEPLGLLSDGWNEVGIASALREQRMERNGQVFMNMIKVIHQPSDTELSKLGVKQWPIWEKEVSIFPWTYDATETCYLLEGDVIVTPDGGQPVRFGKGDLATFPAGMRCTWEIRQAVRKHYQFS